LAGLLTRYADFAADKRYQLADWRIRPLPREMLQYAQSDTHFLLYIYDHLRNELLAMASRPPSPAPAAANEEASGSTSRQHTPETNPQRSLRRVLEASADTALGVYSRDNYDPVTGKGSGGWRMGRKKFLAKAQYGTLEGLVFIRMHQWRDRVARELDESPQYVNSLKYLFQSRVERVRMMWRPSNHGSGN
jgi:exosome complex exonuclease RRP6